MPDLDFKIPVTMRTSIFTILLVACNYGLFAQINITAGLVAYYPFNGNADDESGFSHHPVFNNAALAEDRSGMPNSAYYFNGIDNYMRIPDAPDLNFSDQISIAVWIKPMGFYYGNCHGNSVLAKGDAPTTNGRYLIRFEDGQYLNGNNCNIAIPDTIHQNYWAPGAFLYGGYTPYVQKGEWVSVIYTYNGEYAKLYVNCELVINSTANLTFTNPYDLFLGRLDSPTHPYWYNGVLDDVRLYNRALTEEEVKFIASDGKVMHTPLQTIILPTGGSVKIGTGNISGSYQWNITKENTDSITVDREGLYFVETTGYGCPNIDSFRIVYATADFSFQQDPCTPLNITFKNEAPGSTVIDWDFGNGQHAPGNPNPTITFADFDTYDVTLYITNASGDEELVTKSITVQAQTDDLIVTRDTTICEGTEVQLNAIDALRYCWTPAQSLSAADIPNPVATPAATTIYYLNSLVVGNNIIVNGDFTSGNTGFTSGYNYASVNVTEEQYFVGSNPRAWNVNFTGNCTGRGGSGNMLMMNGSPVVDVQVWTQTVSVIPNTNYAFSTWVQSLFSDNPAQLMFSINGVTIGNTITASLPVCNWKEFYAVWNSGNNTTAVISIINKNTIVWGNDFALDDISFAPVTIKMDSVIVTVEKSPVIKASEDTVICAGNTVQLNASGALTYAWSPSEGLSFTNDYNPEATPVNTIEYIVTGSSSSGCEARDTVAVTVNQRPVVSISRDTAICRNTSVQLLAGGGATYSWQPAITLDDPAVFNPVASPQANTTFTVAVMDANQCSDTTSVKVQIRAYPLFWVSGDTSICAGFDTVVLRAGGGDVYKWSPEYFLDDAFSPDAVASPDVNTRYSVNIGDSQCGHDTTLYVNVTVDPAPALSVSKANDINCAIRSAPLRASGADSYLWSPAGVLDNAVSSNPVATIDRTTTFTVKGMSLNGCYASDTVTVYVTADGNPLFLLPNVFTPNGDGINDCFGIAKWGAVQLEKFSVFNRWGEMVFNTKEASHCWDGTYRGVLQPSGTFVYIIKADTFCGIIERKGTITLLR